MTLKTYKHTPAHLYVDNQVYFFTGAIYHKKKLLVTDKSKEIFLKYLVHFNKKYGWKLLEWVVLDNHYHFLAEVVNSNDMPVMINSLHKTSAFHIKKWLNIQAEPFWYQYWDRCIRNDNDYYKTAAYIFYNPLKHGYVDDLRDYQYSSFHERLKRRELIFGGELKKYRSQILEGFNEIDAF